MTLAFALAIAILFGAGAYLLLRAIVARYDAEVRAFPFGAGDDQQQVVVGIILVSNAVPPFAGGRP